jgi:hypothetical protein
MERATVCHDPTPLLKGAEKWSIVQRRAYGIRLARLDEWIKAL